MALKAKMTIAVPSSIFLDSRSSSFDNLMSKNKIIPKDPIKTISWENSILDVPIVNVKKTKNYRANYYK
jgi:hypothetical protein